MNEHLASQLLRRAEEMNGVLGKPYFGEKRLQVASDYLALLVNHQTRVPNIKNCFECGSIEGVELHHVIPRSFGGKSTIPLCYKCHSKAHGNENMRRKNNHSELIKAGLRKARQNGVKIGRRMGPDEPRKVVEKYKVVSDLLLSGYSIRKTAKLADVSPGTVQKVKKAMIEIGMK